MDDVETMIENLIERLIQGSYNTGKGFSADKPVLERRGQASRGSGPGLARPSNDFASFTPHLKWSLRPHSLIAADLVLERPSSLSHPPSTQSLQAVPQRRYPLCPNLHMDVLRRRLRMG